MAAIDFPNSPTEGQEFTVGNLTWVYNAPVWNLVPGGGGGGLHAKGVMKGNLLNLAANTAVAATEPLTVSVIAGERYRIHFQARAMLTGTVTPPAHLQCVAKAGAITLGDQYSFLSPNAYTHAVIDVDWEPTQTGPVALQVEVAPSISATNVFLDSPTSFFVVDQVGS
jgi:hypothetical protein